MVTCGGSWWFSCDVFMVDCGGSVVVVSWWFVVVHGSFVVVCSGFVVVCGGSVVVVQLWWFCGGLW